jgi:hypothetical protein
MASFRRNDEDMHVRDWELLQNGPITLYYRREILEDDLSWLRDHDYQIDLLDCKDWWWIGDVLDAILPKLALPNSGPGWGGSIDDLFDDLLDLAIPENSGRVLVFYQYDQFMTQAPEIAGEVLDIIAYSARYYLLFGLRLMILVQSNDPKLSFKKVGGCPVSWNNRERLNKDRGL